MCGDVMTGRGVDQILAHPSDPILYESYSHDARDYIELAERVNGPVPRQVSSAYVWGAALDVLREARPAARVVNLETSVTCSRSPWVPKGINYRMHPDNVSCLTAAGIDVCALANNHVLDWGYAGLLETLDVLHGARIATCGAGADRAQAEDAAAVLVGRAARVLVLAFGHESSGVPPEWGARKHAAGVARIEDLSASEARAIGDRIDRHRRPGDIVVVSIHWGGNWGYRVPDAHVRFAHALIDAGADVIHGHSSHHPRPIEVHAGKLVLYGCGDLINDYEGIRGHEEYRGELGIMYFAAVDPTSGLLIELRMVPLRLSRMQLVPCNEEERSFVLHTLAVSSAPFGTQIAAGPRGTIVVHP
ncbi:MAG: CapA family protein [Polyangiaceae bacterium]|nr:CapA family protein [Polyangiaceae bacterium]